MEPWPYGAALPICGEFNRFCAMLQPCLAEGTIRPKGVDGVNIALLARKAAQRVRRYGWRRALRSAWSELVARPEADDFDRRYGTDTARRAPLWRERSWQANFGILILTTAIV